MNKIIKIVIILCYLSLSSCNNKRPENFSFEEPARVSYTRLHPGEVRPSGWIQHQMKRDLESGFAGHLDELTKTAGDSLFIKHRTIKWDGGHWKTDQRFINRPGDIRWYDGETEGNWRLGLTEMAFLGDVEKSMEKISGYLDKVIDKSQSNGYIGMFGPQLRYNSIGDLWSQSLILKCLLSYYELTHEERVLNAVINAVDQMFKAYGVFSKHENLFDINRNGHSLASYTDVAEQLYKITGQEKYTRFIEILYKDFNDSKMIEGSPKSGRRSNDAKLNNLLDLNQRFQGHAVHVVEHIRTLAFLQYCFRDSIKYEWAFENAMKKLGQCLTPSGACIGDEWINRRTGDPEIGYEYCTMTELLATYTSAIEKTGNVALADNTENLVFNAAQGARSSDGKGISYISTDNRLRAEAKYHYYSPTHEEGAVCCNPNAVKLMPLFVQNMWMRYNLDHQEGLACLLFGPSVVSTNINGQQVTIKERTQYPFELSFVFTLELNSPMTFPLYLRIPGWVEDIEITKAEGVKIRQIENALLLNKKWENGDSFKVDFKTSVKHHVTSKDEYYFSHGPLLFALNINEEGRVLERSNCKLPGFDDIAFIPNKNELPKWKYSIEKQKLNHFQFRSNTSGSSYSWDSPKVSLQGELRNKEGEIKKVVLVPFGNTILRRLTFPVYQP